MCGPGSARGDTGCPGRDHAAWDAAFPTARPRHGQRQRVLERDHARLLPGAIHPVHAFATLPKERPGVGRAEEWRGGKAARGLWSARGTEGGEALTRLYASSRLFVNFFQPSFKLASKTRV